VADSTIFDLTAETAMTAAHRLAASTAANVDAKHATFALMGGLEYDTTFDSAADHADISAAVGTLYGVNISAVTTNNLVLTLPDTANVGECIGVYITTGDDAFELEVRTGATGSLLMGVDTSAGTDKWKLFITGEILIMRCIKAGGAGDTDWIVENDGRIPCYGRIDTSGGSVDTINDATWTQIDTFNTEIADIGDIVVAAANDELVLRRDGTYVLTASALGSGTSTGEFRLAIRNEAGTGLIFSEKEYVSEGINITATCGGVAEIDVSANEKIRLECRPDTEDATITISVTLSTYLEALEVL
jgi:hypothetical protein